MKITCQKKELQAALATVTRAVSGRSTLPILAHILLDAKDGALTLSATDLELAITCACAAEVADPGSLTLPAKTLSDLIRELPDAALTVLANEQNSAKLTCGRSEYRLLGLPPEEFPPLPEVATDHAFSIAPGELARMIRSVAPAVSTDDTRPILTGVLAAVLDNRLTLVATDTHRLAVREGQIIPHVDGPRGSIIIPGRALDELARSLSPGAEEPVRVRADQNQVRFDTGQVTLVSRLIEGQYPKYERVIPTSHTKRLLIPVDAFYTAVKRAMIVAKEASNRVTLETDGDLLRISAQAGDLGTAREEVEIEREGEEIALVFNGRYLLDLLGVIESDRLVVDLSEPLTPTVFRPEGEDGFLCVLMPMSVA